MSVNDVFSSAYIWKNNTSVYKYTLYDFHIFSVRNKLESRQITFFFFNIAYCFLDLIKSKQKEKL